MKTFTTIAASTVIAAAAFAAAPEPAEAGAEAQIVVECTATAAGAAICIPLGFLLHELAVAGNGGEAFGPNGEIVRVLKVPVDIIEGNIDGAQREANPVTAVIRGTTGVSLRDIETYGLAGGPNSEVRRLGRGIADIFGW
ncbi:MAG: hypothetical protein Tsb0019_21150 [Roseibium sp.]